MKPDTITAIREAELEWLDALAAATTARVRVEQCERNYWMAVRIGLEEAGAGERPESSSSSRKEAA